METYDKNQNIIASNTDFEELRAKVYTLLNNSNRNNPIGTQGINNISDITTVSSSVVNKEKLGSYIDKNPFVNAINMIYNFINNKYMNIKNSNDGSTFSLVPRILEQGIKEQYDIIPALTDYYTIINYWNNGTDTSTNHRCNGACSGFCSGTCYGQAKGIGKINQDTESQYCTGSLCDGSCHHVCYNACSYDCNENCDGMCEKSGNAPVIGEVCDWCVGGCMSCSSNCGGGCSTCSSSCMRLCAEDCARGCSGCSTQCGSLCNDSCKDGCGVSCSGTCTFASASH